MSDLIEVYGKDQETFYKKFSSICGYDGDTTATRKMASLCEMLISQENQEEKKELHSKLQSVEGTVNAQVQEIIRLREYIRAIQLQNGQLEETVKQCKVEINKLEETLRREKYVHRKDLCVVRVCQAETELKNRELLTKNKMLEIFTTKTNTTDQPSTGVELLQLSQKLKTNGEVDGSSK